MAQEDTGQSNNRPVSHNAELDQLDRFGASKGEKDTADRLLYEGWWGGRLAPWKSARRARARDQYESGKQTITGEGFDWAAWRRDGGGRDSPKNQNQGDSPEGNTEQGEGPGDTGESPAIEGGPDVDIDIPLPE